MKKWMLGLMLMGVGLAYAGQVIYVKQSDGSFLKQEGSSIEELTQQKEDVMDKIASLNKQIQEAQAALEELNQEATRLDEAIEAAKTEAETK